MIMIYSSSEIKTVEAYGTADNQTIYSKQYLQIVNNTSRIS